VQAHDSLGFYAETKTDSSGHYRVEGLHEGETARLAFFAGAYAFAQLKGVPVGSVNADVVMTQMGGIGGVVTDAATGSPIGRFSVSGLIRNTDGGFGGQIPRRDFTAGSGEFLHDNVPPGIARVIASASGYAPREIDGITVKSGEVTSGLEFPLSPGGTVTGIIMSAADSRPIAGAKVSIRAMFDQEVGFERMALKAVSASDGSFELKNLAPGGHTVMVEHSDFVPTRAIVTAREGVETRTVIRLGLGGVLAGYITANGLPSAGARVELGIRGAGPRFAQTNASGYYEFKALTTGTYTMMVTNIQRAPGFQEATVQIEEGRVTQKDFDF